MSGGIAKQIDECVRNNQNWQNLPPDLIKIFKNTQTEYNNYILNYSLKNQLRFRGNLVRQIFRNEQRYYELLIEKSIAHLCLFPYHLADIVTKGLRVTPFNYYLDVISYLLKHDKSYDTLPNFTAADCLRVLGIGRNEYLAIISDLKTNTSKLFRKPNPLNFLPKFPVRINIEPWWKVEVGCVLESDIKYVNDIERGLIDDLIDFGSRTAGHIDFNIVHSLYRKGLIYLDVPISGEDKISIPPLKNFVMNRVSGDYFENLLYTIFVTADEYMTISELSQMLQVNLDSVKHAVSLCCRLGFARKKSEIETEIMDKHNSWELCEVLENERPQITPLNFHSLLINDSNDGFFNEKNFATTPQTPNVSNSLISPISSNEKDINISNECISSSDGDFSFLNSQNEKKSTSDELSSGIEDITEIIQKTNIQTKITISPKRDGRNSKRIGFLFDSTLTAFLMMGNLSPGLKNHAVTLFEVGKLCDESMDTFLSELEKVSLLDAEGEGEVSRYFAHAVILRSTICALRNLCEGGLDLLRLECLESLDIRTRDKLLEKKYKFLISAAPITSILTHQFSIPIFGQFYRSSDNTHIWTKMFYYHISGYGPPSLLLTRGTVLKSLPMIFLGYGKLLITIQHTDSYIINSENCCSINDQLKNGCVLVQGYGIKEPGEIKYEAFPFDTKDASKAEWFNHKAIIKLKEILNLENTCGYITFLNTGVKDIGCENYDINVHMEKPKSKKNRKASLITDDGKFVPPGGSKPLIKRVLNPDLLSPMDGSEITNFKIPQQPLNNLLLSTTQKLKSPDENYFSNSPVNEENKTANITSPSNIFQSLDCNELIENELAKLEENDKNRVCENYDKQLVSQSSIEIAIESSSNEMNKKENVQKNENILLTDDYGEKWTILDVNFGVPLFDIDCNTSICVRLIKQLSNENNLCNLKSINENMNDKFLRFISQCLYFEDECIGYQLKTGKLIPPPKLNLAFENGKVCYWNSK